MRIQSDVKVWAWFGGARAGDPTLKIIVELMRDEPLLVQRPVPLYLLPKGRLAEKSDLQGRHLIGVLATYSIERIGYPVPTPLDDLARQLRDALAKHWDEAPAIEAEKPIHQ